MIIEKIRLKMHNIVDEIDDETILNIIMEDAEIYAFKKTSNKNDDLNLEK